MKKKTKPQTPINCIGCGHFSSDNRCTCPDGLLHGIRISEQMSEAEHDCKAFKEAAYIISEVGHLYLAMKDEGIEIEFDVTKRICDRFFESMMKAGLLTKGGEQ